LDPLEVKKGWWTSERKEH